MNKKGFSLIELLAVIIIVGVISSIAVWGFNSIFKNANKNALEAKETIILSAAQMYGEDYYSLIDTSCEISGRYADCLVIKVQDLLDIGYYKSSEKCKDGSQKECVYNDVTKELMNEEKIVVYDDSTGVKANFLKDLNIKFDQ